MPTFAFILRRRRFASGGCGVWAGPACEHYRTYASSAAWAQQVLAAQQSLDTYDRCPAVGRGTGAYALGGWTARSSGLSFPETPLRAVADNFLATQYGADKTPGSQQTWAGLYGYATRLGVAQDACFVPGALGEGLGVARAAAPSICSTSSTGRFANERFAVADFDAAVGLRDGGAGFDTVAAREIYSY